MKLTVEKLKSLSACQSGIDWFKEQKETDCKKVVQVLIKVKKLDWANWLVSRVLDRKDKIRYACYAAKQVLPIFEKKCPEDKRPRKAIDAAMKCIKNDIKENRDAAYADYAAAHAAAYAADAAAHAAAYAADAAANSAAYAAYAADAAANSAANAAYAAYAAYADYAAAHAAANAAYAADADYAAANAAMKIKILKYGIKLIT